MTQDFEMKQVSKLKSNRKLLKASLITAIVILIVGLLATIILNLFINERYDIFAKEYADLHAETPELITDELISTAFYDISLNSLLSLIVSICTYMNVLMVVLIIISVVVRKILYNKLIKVEYFVKDCME